MGPDGDLLTKFGANPFDGLTRRIALGVDYFGSYKTNLAGNLSATGTNDTYPIWFDLFYLKWPKVPQC